MCGKFESRFKQCDESSVNDFNSRAPGKLRLSTQVPYLSGFPPFNDIPLTVTISSPLTIAPGRRRPAPTRRMRTSRNAAGRSSTCRSCSGCGRPAPPDGVGRLSNAEDRKTYDGNLVLTGANRLSGTAAISIRDSRSAIATGQAQRGSVTRTPSTGSNVCTPFGNARATVHSGLLPSQNRPARSRKSSSASMHARSR